MQTVDETNVAKAGLVAANDVSKGQHHTAAGSGRQGRQVPAAFLADPKIKSNADTVMAFVMGLAQ